MHWRAAHSSRPLVCCVRQPRASLAERLPSCQPHPLPLPADGVDVVIRILRRLCILGGEPNPPKPPPPPPPAPAADAAAGGEGAAAAAGEGGAAAAPDAPAEAAAAAGAGGEAMETEEAAARPAGEAMDVEGGQPGEQAQQAQQDAAMPAAEPPAGEGVTPAAAAAGGEAAAGQAEQPAAAGAEAAAAELPEEEEEEEEEVVADDPEAESYLVECVTYTGGLGRNGRGRRGREACQAGRVVLQAARLQAKPGGRGTGAWPHALCPPSCCPCLLRSPHAGNDADQRGDGKVSTAAGLLANRHVPCTLHYLAEPPSFGLPNCGGACCATPALLPPHCRLFVERGGVELLLTLYRLPRLPPTFGSTNASHRRGVRWSCCGHAVALLCSCCARLFC